MSQTATPTLTRTVDGREVPAPGTYAFDLSHSSVGLVVRHLVVSKVRARFDDWSGSLTIGERPEDSSVEVTIQTASFNSGEEARDAHVRSADFFDVDQFPTATYRSTKVTPNNGGNWLVDGELTIRGITQPVSLLVNFEGAATDPYGNSKVAFEASTEIERDNFGVSFNAPLEAGGFVLGKKVSIELEVQALPQA